MLTALLSPRGVAVIGASRNPNKLGYGVARNLVISGYRGEIYFVNPHGGRLFDRPLYANIAQVPDPVDLAVILIPAQAVPGVLEECGQRGVRAAIVGSGGFREIGPEGVALEERCLAIARQYGLRVVGPNCIGYLDTHLPIDTSFLPLPGPIQGDIAFLSHSGAICEAAIDWARGQGFGLSRLISLGNQMDLTESDLLPPTAADPHTRVVAMYLEGVRDGASFIERAQEVTPQKPVVAIKVGRSESGQIAATSHTGALAGRDEAYAAAFRKAGIIRARHSEEMFDWTRALAWCPVPEGRAMAVLTNAGGPGVIAADSIEANGLRLAGLTSHTQERLAELLPSAASLVNPVDMLAAAGPREYAECLRALLEDEGVDGVLLIILPPPLSTAADVAGAVVPVIRATGKPVVVALMGEDLIVHAARLFRQTHIPDYRFPERAASALRVLADRAEWLGKPVEEPVQLEDIQPQTARSILEEVPLGADGFLNPEIASRVVGTYGIQIPPEILVQTEEAAIAKAEEMGYPVVLKVASPDLSHKSDIGGVLLGLSSRQQVVDGFRTLTRDLPKEYPEADIQGALMQPMIASGEEVIVGVVRDEQFGHLVMFGSGGVEVEGLRDVAFALAPLSRVEAEQLVDSTWAGRKLRGYRNIQPMDRQAVIDTLLRLGQLAVDIPRIVEMEINPLRVLPGEGGALALDVRIRLAD